jgi:hypothetical protein
MEEHAYSLEQTAGRRHVAVCTCGWTSDALSTAGMAGAAWDAHRDGTIDLRETVDLRYADAGRNSG